MTHHHAGVRPQSSAPLGDGRRTAVTRQQLVNADLSQGGEPDGAPRRARDTKSAVPHECRPVVWPLLVTDRHFFLCPFCFFLSPVRPTHGPWTSFPAFTPAPLVAAAAVGRLRGSGTLSLRRAFGSPLPLPAAPPPPRRVAGARRLPGGRSAATMSAVESPPATGVVYVKAGPDGSSIGDCPFSLKVLLAAALKGVPVELVTVDLANKPASFLALTDAGSTPVFVHAGRTLAESGEILTYVDTLGDASAAGSLAAPLATADPAVAAAVGGVFGVFARLMKNKEAGEEAARVAALEAALAAVDGVLEAGGGPFLVGPWVSALDCDLIPKLRHVVAAAGHYKGFSVAGHGWDALEQYIAVTGG